MKITVVLFCVLASMALAEKMPNVVLIFADDLGYGDLGCYGATKVQKPNVVIILTNDQGYGAILRKPIITPSMKSSKAVSATNRGR